jgi:mannose-6-phosphate isomerase-like protein (cupin superfamily)
VEHLYPVDLDKHALPNGRSVHRLLQRSDIPAPYAVTCIRTPPGGGSPEGLHTHVYEQVFYLISGRMNLEIDGKTYCAEPETLIVFPAGVAHRNWNAGPEATVHLVFQIGPAPRTAHESAAPKGD